MPSLITALTGFLLTGGHADPPRQCVDCHVNNNYNLTSSACFSCHQKDFASAASPVPHDGFPTTCEQCHDVVQWTDGKFDHSTTGFTLTGLHTDPPRQCSDCHVNGNYTLNSTACVSCHLKDFQGTTNPNHVTGGFAADLRDLSHHQQLDGRDIRPQQNRIPAHRTAYRCRRAPAPIATLTTTTP